MAKNRVPNHYGYSVLDLEESAQYWAKHFGAGPFLSLGQVEFDSATSFGVACTFLHTPAFGAWGDLVIELQQIHECSPPALRSVLIPTGRPILNHVSFVSADPEADSASLAEAGMPMFMHLKKGEIDARFHDARHVFGHSVEIHRRSDSMESFHARVRRAARGWDGLNTLKPASAFE